MTWLLALMILATPIPAEVLSDIKAVPVDPPETNLIIKHHYLSGNEHKLDLFTPYIRNKGGVYIGVGADQNYNLVAQARPDLMILMDYDEVVVMGHMIHAVLLAASETADELIGRYGKDQQEASLKLLEEAWGDHPKWTKLRSLYPRLREKLSRVLQRGRALGRRGRRIYFLADEEQFRFIRDLARAGRIIPMDGNLLGAKTIRNLAAALKKHKLQVKVLYLSNAEQYWKPLPRSFIENIAAVPFAQDGLVIRTYASNYKRWTADGEYHYNVQSGRHLQAYFSSLKKKITIKYLLRQGAEVIRPGLSIIGLSTGK